MYFYLCKLFILIYKFLGYIGQLLSFIYRIISNQPRPGISQINTQWLQNELQKIQILEKNNSISKIEISNLSGRGLAGCISRFQTTFKNQKNPQTFVLKMSANSPSGRTSVIASTRYREAFFYQNLSKLGNIGTAQLKLPKIFFSYGSAVLGEYVIIMEDLTSSFPESIGVNFFFGNQIYPIPENLRDVSQKYSPKNLIELVFRNTAEIQAKFWRDKKLLSHSWLKGVSWYKGENRIQWECGLNRGLRAWNELAVKYYNSSTTRFKLSPKLYQIIKLSFSKSSWQNFQNHIQNPAVPWTLCHGDFHASNMILTDPKNPEIILFDWSEVGVWEPTTDLGQMLISDVKPELVKENSKRWIKVYWERLLECGVNPNEYPFEVCWESFCESSVSRWLWLFVVLGGFVSEEAMEYFQNQILSFIEAHGNRPYYILRSLICLV